MRSPLPTGVLVTMALLAVGLVAAGVAWWNNLSHTQQALGFWGPEAAVLIRDAPHVTAFHVEFAKSADDGGTSDDPGSAASGDALVHPSTGAPAEVIAASDISSAKGLVHLRHALLDDRSFDWTSRRSEPVELRYALSFERDGRRLDVFLSGDFTRLIAQPLEPAEARAASTAPIAEGLRKYFVDVLPSATK